MSKKNKRSGSIMSLKKITSRSSFKKKSRRNGNNTNYGNLPEMHSTHEMSMSNADAILTSTEENGVVVHTSTTLGESQSFSSSDSLSDEDVQDSNLSRKISASDRNVSQKRLSKSKEGIYFNKTNMKPKQKPPQDDTVPDNWSLDGLTEVQSLGTRRGSITFTGEKRAGTKKIDSSGYQNEFFYKAIGMNPEDDPENTMDTASPQTHQKAGSPTAFPSARSILSSSSIRRLGGTESPKKINRKNSLMGDYSYSPISASKAPSRAHSSQKDAPAGSTPPLKNRVVPSSTPSPSTQRNPSLGASGEGSPNGKHRVNTSSDSSDNSIQYTSVPCTPQPDS